MLASACTGQDGRRDLLRGADGEAMPDYAVDLTRAEQLQTEFVQGLASLPIRFNPC